MDKISLAASRDAHNTALSSGSFHDIEHKKIVLTGGAGFIGSHIATALLRLNPNRLVIIDNLSTGNIANISDVLLDDRVEFVFGDITDINVCRKIVEGADIICHQAALGSVPRSLADPLASHNANVNGFVNILLAAKDAGVKRFVYASSSSVYGDSQILPKEEPIMGDPISPYAATKKITEIYANVFTRCYGMECIGLRYFNIFGPKQNKNGPYAAVIPRFMDALSKGESPVVYGDGNQSRDFTYVANAVQANLLAMSTTESRCFGKVFNIATGGCVTLNEMYAIMQDYLGLHHVEIIHGNPRPGDIEHSWASIKRSGQLLGYHPQVTFIQGLRETMDYYMSHL